MNTHPQEYSVKQAIIQFLSDGEFHSGEDLGGRLGMSRAAIGKHIKGIQEWGLEIHSVQGKGYQLSHPIDLLDIHHIQQQVENPIYPFSVIDSTNQYLLDHLNELTSGTICLAEYQTQGRGRRGRVWHSPYGANLSFSMYWCLTSGVAAAMGLSLAIGVAIIDALESLGAKDIALKWPNDLYYRNKKLAGVLVEMSAQTGDVADLVIGMGLNIHMPTSSEDIDQPWSNLSDAFYDHIPSKNEIVIALIRAWTQTLNQYEEQGLSAFVARWNQYDNFKDKPIKLLMGNKTVTGIGKGINEQGAIRIETEKGIETYIGGEISLRSHEPQ